MVRSLVRFKAIEGCSILARLPLRHWICLFLAAMAAMLTSGDAAAVAPKTLPKKPTSNPFASARFYVDPHSASRVQIEKWKGSRPEDAKLLERIAGRSQAEWFLDDVSEVADEVGSRVDKIVAARALPVLVAYAIPGRDCGSNSQGGAADAVEYRKWIREFARGIGSRKAVVVLEPDALADLDTADCLDDPLKTERIALLKDAVTTLKQRPGISVYIDAGNSGWRSTDRTAELLLQVGIKDAAGFALNVSNFVSTAETQRYGDEISRKIGNKHFIVDTSRNGHGPDPGEDWCNPPNQGLGSPPTTRTRDLLCDALLWIKSPGESDGDGPECHGGPAAGVWWSEYALGLCQRASPEAAEPLRIGIPGSEAR